MSKSSTWCTYFLISIIHLPDQLRASSTHLTTHSIHSLLDHYFPFNPIIGKSLPGIRFNKWVIPFRCIPDPQLHHIRNNSSTLQSVHPSINHSVPPPLTHLFYFPCTYRWVCGEAEIHEACNPRHMRNKHRVQCCSTSIHQSRSGSCCWRLWQVVVVDTSHECPAVPVMRTMTTWTTEKRKVNSSSILFSPVHIHVVTKGRPLAHSHLEMRQIGGGQHAAQL